MGFLWVKLKKGRSPATVAPDADLFMGNGLTTRKNAEPVLLCPRGKSLRRDAGVLETIIAAVREHSRKPIELPKEIADQIIDRTDGVPLFIEELTKAVVESGVLIDTGDQYTVAGPLPPLAIPTLLAPQIGGIQPARAREQGCGNTTKRGSYRRVWVGEVAFGGGGELGRAD
jgi:hypothetical protein